MSFARIDTVFLRNFTDIRPLFFKLFRPRGKLFRSFTFSWGFKLFILLLNFFFFLLNPVLISNSKRLKLTNNIVIWGLFFCLDWLNILF